MSSESRRPFPRSLCHQCGHLRTVTSGTGSVFLMCGWAVENRAEHPHARKYPPQPVLRCDVFSPADSDEPSCPDTLDAT